MSPSWPVSGSTRLQQRCRHERLCSSRQPTGTIHRRRQLGWERGQEKGWSGCQRWHKPGSAPQDPAQRAAHPRLSPEPPGLSPERQLCRLRREGSVSRDSRARAETSPGFWEPGPIGNFLPGTAAQEGTPSPLGQTAHGLPPSGSTSRGAGGVQASSAAQARVTRIATAPPPPPSPPRHRQHRAAVTAPAPVPRTKAGSLAHPGGFPARPRPRVPQG